MHEVTLWKRSRVYVDSELSFEYHITKIAKKGNQMAGLLWGTFQHIDEDMFKTLYKKTTTTTTNDSITPGVRCTGVAPYTWKLAEEWEKVQRRATKRVPSLMGLEYEERIGKLKLSTLIYRRIWGDKCLQIYKQHLWNPHWLIFSWKIQTQRPQEENKETPFQAKRPPLLLQPESHWLVEQAAKRSDQCDNTNTKMASGSTTTCISVYLWHRTIIYLVNLWWQTKYLI